MALEKYALELKRLKLFSAKWQAYYQKADFVEKQELSNILTDLLRDSHSVDFVVESKKKVDAIMEQMGETFEPIKIIQEYFDSEDNGFNLDDAINPKEDLSLEELCKELGVFEG